MIERCAGGVKLDFKKRCATCGAGPGDQCAKAALRDFEERQALAKDLAEAVKLLDALLGLEKGSGEAALAFVERHSGAVGIAGRQGERS